MCGIAGIFGSNWDAEQLTAMHAAQRHRGYDAEGFYFDPRLLGGLAHNRLSILDLSDAGRQPFQSVSGDLQIVLNGEIYNYLELRRELEGDHIFRTQTDTEVLLAAFEKWGHAALDRLIGMFALIIWDERTKTAFAARDRFGVKPLYYHQESDGTLLLASEIKAIHAAGVRREPNLRTWSSFLTHGVAESSEETFWSDIDKLPAGHFLVWRDGQTTIRKWYDLYEKSGDGFDDRDDQEVAEEYLYLLKDTVRLRFRSDVPVGINLSGGVDSSTLLGLVHAIEEGESRVAVYTFTTGDERYDELPWVERMLEQTKHPLVVSKLAANEVPDLAADVQYYQDEPFGGIPTLAYAKLFEEARKNGTIVLLDGNGIDEQWGGYDYYSANGNGSLIQGSSDRPVRPDCLMPEFRAVAEGVTAPMIFSDRLRNLQYRDVVYTKIPRALRYNDRISMRATTELREPFLDHRLFELALRQPGHRKIAHGIHKKMMREIAAQLVSTGISEAPKRPVQTPQREWLRTELREWADDIIEAGMSSFGAAWFNRDEVRREWKAFCDDESDNSFYVWQWISLGLIERNVSGINFGGLNPAARISNRSTRTREEVSAW
ncbi:MAG: asparagine synthase (glutamine-hydrolyzing) [Pyrinomonadaceae bacterium]